MKQAYSLCIILLISLPGISQTVDFTFTSAGGLFCAPSTISFTPQASGAPVGYLWDFGNNNQSNSANPTIVFPSAGIFSVRLTAIYDQSAVEITKTITIDPTVAIAINYDRNYICQPGIINFTGASTGNISSYSWDFGDGSPQATTAAAPHNFTSFGNYTVSLKATSATGCTGTVTTAIRVEKPAITASVTPGLGCVPASAVFSANVSLPTGGSVSSYQWNFGDASPAQTTTGNAVTHLYNLTGGYSPVLNIVTNEGCTNTYSYPAVNYGTPPTNLVAYLQNDTICGSQLVGAVAKATNANAYYWDYGDGTNAVVSDTITFHKYLTLGSKTLTVTPYFNGCPGIAATKSVYVTGIIALFNFSNSCADTRSFNFSSQSLGRINNTSWNFGDGAVLSGVTNTIHKYLSPGIYTTVLTAKDSISGCADSIAKTIYIGNGKLLNNDSVICKGARTTFTLVNNFRNPGAQYIWHVAGGIYGPFNDTSFSVTAAVPGSYYDSVLIFNGPEYCVDIVFQSRPLIVKGLILDFSVTDSSCLNNPITPLNRSAPFYPADTVRLWLWNFGENSLVDTVYQPAAHRYGGAGIFSIRLKATDKNGCTDSLVKPVTILPIPFVRSIPSVDTICLGQVANLVAFHSDSLRWQPAGLVSCATCDTVQVSPNTTTQFYATARNLLGCNSSDSSLVKVFTPFRAVAPFTDSSICLNDSIGLNMLPVGKKISWTPPGSLSNPAAYNPVAFPSQSTIYKAVLSDSAGCFADSASINVVVNSLPTVDAGPDLVFPFNSSYTLNPVYSPNTVAYEWFPGNGLTCSNCPTPRGTASNTTTYTIRVLSDSGCAAQDSVTVYVECKDANMLMAGAFTPDNNQLNDVYYPLTRGIRTIKSFSIYNRMGQLIFQAKNFAPNNRAFGWNGKLNGNEQPSGVYIYILEAECDLGESMAKKGSFLLIR